MKYSAIADKALAIKLLNERCLECSICAIFDKDGNGKQYFLLQYHKTVIGNLTRKKVFQMFTDIFLVVMFETMETTGVKQN